MFFYFGVSKTSSDVFLYCLGGKSKVIFIILILIVSFSQALGKKDLKSLVPFKLSEKAFLEGVRQSSIDLASDQAKKITNKILQQLVQEFYGRLASKFITRNKSACRIKFVYREVIPKVPDTPQTPPPPPSPRQRSRKARDEIPYTPVKGHFNSKHSPPSSPPSKQPKSDHSYISDRIEIDIGAAIANALKPIADQLDALTDRVDTNVKRASATMTETLKHHSGTLNEASTQLQTLSQVLPAIVASQSSTKQAVEWLGQQVTSLNSRVGTDGFLNQNNRCHSDNNNDAPLAADNPLPKSNANINSGSSLAGSNPLPINNSRNASNNNINNTDLASLLASQQQQLARLEQALLQQQVFSTLPPSQQMLPQQLHIQQGPLQQLPQLHQQLQVQVPIQQTSQQAQVQQLLQQFPIQAPQHAHFPNLQPLQLPQHLAQNLAVQPVSQQVSLPYIFQTQANSQSPFVLQSPTAQNPAMFGGVNWPWTPGR